MATQDKVVTLGPYFKVHEGRLPEFKKYCERFVEQTRTKRDCLYYGYCFDGDLAFCREGFTSAEAVLAHLKNVAPITEEALKISSIVRVEVCGPESELTKLRDPMARWKPQFFVLEFGFRR